MDKDLVTLKILVRWATNLVSLDINQIKGSFIKYHFNFANFPSRKTWRRVETFVTILMPQTWARIFTGFSLVNNHIA